MNVQTKSPNLPRSPIKHTPMLSARSAVGRPKYRANRRTSDLAIEPKRVTICNFSSQYHSQRSESIPTISEKADMVSYSPFVAVPR